MIHEEAIKLAKDMLVKPFEGCAKKIPDGMLEAYPDPASPLVTSRQYKYPYKDIPYEALVELGSPWTIGYGATGKGIGPGTVWTLEQAETALDEHLIEFLVPLLKMSPALNTELPRRIAGVLSWVYNCGLGNYRISTFKKRIDAKDWVGAQVECKKWDKARGRVLRGLTLRREAEALLLG